MRALLVSFSALLILCADASTAFSQVNTASTRHVFPQLVDGKFADGTFYRSELIMVNASGAPSNTCSVYFFGIPGSVFGFSSNVGQVTLDADGSLSLISLGQDSFSAGYVAVECSAVVEAFASYALFSAQGVKQSEAAVLSAEGSQVVKLIADESNGQRLGIAFANDSGSPVEYSIKANGREGKIVLQPRQSSAAFLDELLQLLAPYSGPVTISASQGLAYAVGLKFTGPVFTTIPAFPASTSTLSTSTSFSGSGQQVVGPFALTAGLTVAQLSHSGSSHFAVWVFDSVTGERLDLLVNTIGSFNGSTALRIEDASQFVLQISADGNWDVSLDQPQPARGLGLPTTLIGTGQTASDFITLPSGLRIFDLTHSGRSNFSVFLLDVDGYRVDLLANDIGSFSGSKAVSITSSGIHILDISADGPWSITVR